MILAFITKNFIDHFSFAHRVINMHVQLSADIMNLLLIHTGYVKARVFFDRIVHANTLVRSLEINFFSPSDRVTRAGFNHHLCRTVHSERCFFH